MYTHTIFDQLLQQTAPLCAEDIRTSQTAIPTNDTQVGDAMPYQVIGSLETALACGESFAAGTANDGATLKQTSQKRKEVETTRQGDVHTHL